MGTRAYSESHQLVKRRGGLLPANYRLQVLFDGSVVAGSGQQANLPGNELWWDGTGLHRIGLNIGPTFQNLGPVACEIFGAIAPKEYANLINTQASLIAIMTGRWKSLGSLATGDVITTNMMVFSLYKFVFAAGSKGEVVAVTL